MSMLDDLEAEASGDRPAFLTKNPKFSLDDLEAEAKSATSPKKGAYAELQADLAEARAKNSKPDLLDSAYTGLRRGASFGFSDELEGAHHRLYDLATGTPGKSYADYRDEARGRDNAAAAEHPIAAIAGETVGGLASSAVPGLGPSMKAARGTEAAAAGLAGKVAAARRALTSESAKAFAKQGALAGAGGSEADLTKGDVGGFARDVGASALVSGATGAVVGRLIRGAPERVDESALHSINVGDDTNSKLSTARKVMARAGEGGEDLFGILDENPSLKKVLATKAASDPRAAEKFVGRRLDHLSEQTKPIYEAIDAAPDPRFVGGPDKGKATGGVDIHPLYRRLGDAVKRFADEGKATLSAATEKARQNLAKLYGTEMEDGSREVIPGTVLPSRSVRNYANEVGEIAFAGDPTVSPKVRARAQQYLYREITDSIAAAGQQAGVDVGKLKNLNKEISTLIPIRQALTERATQAEAGRKSLSETIRHAALPALGGAVGMGGHGAHGGLTGLAVGAGAYAAGKAAKPIARAADWQLAKLVLASRNGSTPAQLGQLAIEMGLSRVVAGEIAKRGVGALGSE